MVSALAGRKAAIVRDVLFSADLGELRNTERRMRHRACEDRA